MEPKATYSPEAEPQLLLQAAQGGREAYAVLYQYYLPRLYKYLYGIIRSKEETEEILQDIFLKLWEKKEDLSTVKTLNSYLFRIARNKLMNHYDHQKVRQKAADYIGQQDETSGCTAEDQYIYKQYNEVVQKALSSLPPKRRQVFEMSTQQDLSYDQIAEELNISKSMVKKQFYAANSYVKEYLQLHAGLTTSIAIAAGALFIK
ncbi:RNA polymerase sigma factor [Mucilaginibacter ginsenosidivorans]|uniref:RNA polymerase sigma-70 factor n=1 Tax=Mucilaginibacter ginsenosidivorans TaxID=398053 RepID=A0A5B8UU33_9SPHI|nr:RNA polymerase sigma-70 factor [Mucilaginibacter ginsenosidivorans]QEC62432.1 RNA polymerase sigma-70 factor [Mucilaginibacter ginsenosidivorans]